MGLDASERMEPSKTNSTTVRSCWDVVLIDGCAVSTARRAVRRCLNKVVSEQLVDDTVIVVSELVSNTYSHALEARVLRVSLFAGGVRVEISGIDPSPVLHQHDKSQTVLVLDRLCTDWGVRAEPNRASEGWAVLLNDLS